MNGLARVLPLMAVVTLFPARAHAQAPVAQPQIGISGIRLACFSPQRAFAESAEGKAGLATLTALQQKRSREIEDRNKTLEAREQALQQSLTLLTEDARNQRTKELEKFRLDTQRFVEDAQAEFLGVRREIEAAFAAKLKPALEQIAKARSLLLVLSLDEPSLAWADPTIDITADVVQQLASAAR